MTTTAAPGTGRRANPQAGVPAADANPHAVAAATAPAQQQPTPTGDRRNGTNGDARSAAIEAWLSAAATGNELTGAQLAQRYNRSPSWGRAVVRDARRQQATATRSPAATKPQAPVRPPVVVVTRAIRRLTLLAVVVVAAVAAVASYAHMAALAEAAGEEWRAAVLPLSVDGMMLAASMTALVRRRAGKTAGVAWSALLLGIAASVAANVAAAQPTLEGRLVAAWPPLALLLAIELALQQTRHDHRERQR